MDRDSELMKAVANEEMSEGFQSFDLKPELFSALEHLGYKKPSPIQEKCLPVLLEGRDVLGLAQTGSGKTAAFSLPGLNQIDTRDRATQMLVVAPTRELAVQVAAACTEYARFIKGINIVAIYGGQSYEVQVRALSKGAHVIVGTPGRLLDLLKSRRIDLSQVKFLVLDEADEMLRMGFIEAVSEILEKVPEQRQTALFSATMPESIRKLSRNFMRQPTEIRIESQTRTASSVAQYGCLASSVRRKQVLLRFLEVEDFDAALIFVRTKGETLELANYLSRAGFRVAALNGDMTQLAREQTLSSLKEGRIDLLVATDVAARGLDVDRLSWVINYDLPMDPETYVHRIGRTGRGGRTGKALLLVEPEKLHALRKIERMFRTKVEFLEVPKLSEIARRRIEKLALSLRTSLQREDEPGYRELLDQVCGLLDRKPDEVAVELLKLLQKERRLILPLEPLLGMEEEMTACARSHSSQGRMAAPRGALHSRQRTTPRFGGKASKPWESGQSASVGMARGPRRPHASEAGPMVRYRFGLGRSSGLEARHIVGALINEGKLRGDCIGAIKLFDEYAEIELSSSVAPEKIRSFSGIKLFNRPIALLAPSAVPGG